MCLVRRHPLLPCIPNLDNFCLHTKWMTWGTTWPCPPHHLRGLVPVGGHTAKCLSLRKLAEVTLWATWVHTFLLSWLLGAPEGQPLGKHGLDPVPDASVLPLDCLNALLVLPFHLTTEGCRPPCV